MPPEKGLGTHHEGGPGRAGKRSAGRRKHHAVEPPKAGPSRLTPEDLQLMAKDEDLYPGRRCATFDIAHTAANQHVGSEYAVFADSVSLTSLEGLGKRSEAAS